MESGPHNPLEEKETELSASWSRPDVMREIGEITRTAKTFSKDEAASQDFFIQMVDAFRTKELQELSEEMWGQLENTDSYHIKKGDLKEVEHRGFNYHRNPGAIIEKIKSGETLTAPTIAIYKNVPHKVGGNTRLMVARALGITPQVVVSELVEHGSAPIKMNDLELEIAAKFFLVAEKLKTKESTDEFIEKMASDPEISKQYTNVKHLEEVFFKNSPPASFEKFIKRINQTA